MKVGNMVRFTTSTRNHITGIILSVNKDEYLNVNKDEYLFSRYRIIDSLGKIGEWCDYHFMVIL